LRIKHDPADRLSPVLAELLIDRWGDSLRDLGVDVIVPIPAHWTTRWARAARPADAIAHRLGAFLKAPCDLHILRKSRRTPAQSSLTPARRRENLRDAFRLESGVRIEGLKVLLVDDVLTTGTTADRAARVLQQAGCREVDVAVIARGIGR
jgi:predicted amidophosphoribosyltransferase